MNAVFVINGFIGGGAERVVQTLSNYFVNIPGNNVTVILLDDIKQLYVLDEKVKIIILRSSFLVKGIGKVLAMPIQGLELARLLKKLHPDVVLSLLFRPNMVHIMTSFFGNDSSIYISERSIPTEKYSAQNIENKVINYLIKRSYPKASGILAISQGVKKSLQNDYYIDGRIIKVVHNPQNIEYIISKSRKEVDLPPGDSSFRIVTVGRLVLKKDHETLLRAFAQVKARGHDTKLIVIGTGPEINFLQKLAKDLKIEEDIYWMDWQENPFAIMAKCDLFVITSLFEGFGNTIVEAMACGLPIISTDCPGGPTEILENDRYGILTPVGDVNSLAKAIEKLLNDKRLLNHYKKQALKRAKQFDVSLIASEYLDFFKKYR